eukprot:2850818-Pleurochrysis_carterae.AAC.1
MTPGVAQPITIDLLRLITSKLEAVYTARALEAAARAFSIWAAAVSTAAAAAAATAATAATASSALLGCQRFHEMEVATFSEALALVCAQVDTARRRDRQVALAQLLHSKRETRYASSLVWALVLSHSRSLPLSLPLHLPFSLAVRVQARASSQAGTYATLSRGGAHLHSLVGVRTHALTRPTHPRDLVRAKRQCTHSMQSTKRQCTHEPLSPHRPA